MAEKIKGQVSDYMAYLIKEDMWNVTIKNEIKVAQGLMNEYEPMFILEDGSEIYFINDFYIAQTNNKHKNIRMSHVSMKEMMNDFGKQYESEEVPSFTEFIINNIK